MEKYKKTLLIIFLTFPLLIHAQQIMYTKGGMFVAGDATESGRPALYINGGITAGEATRIAHSGKTILTGNFVNNVTSGNVFTSRNGIFEFKGADQQLIKGTANKANNYIKFPTQVIISMNTDNHQKSVVLIDAGMGVTMKNLKFNKGRLVVDSKALPATNKTDFAHLLVESGANIAYKHLPQATIAAEQGFVQVNLDLDGNHLNGGLAGIASPYKTLYADYFFFNFLSMPKTNKLFDEGSDALWIRNPLTALTPGVGYILGQAIVPHSNTGYYNNMLDDEWKKGSVVPEGAKFADVVTDKYYFGRMLAPASFTQFNTKNNRYTGEELNIADVTVPLTENFNYLGNPFTVPLDLSSYLDAPETSGFGTFAVDEMENKVYLLSEGSHGMYSNAQFTFTASFQHISKVGGTYTGSPLIAPMQMFVVKKNTSSANTFKMPLSKRSHGNAPLLRSAGNEVIDELLIETKDMITGGYDRLCIVFRADGSPKANHKYDAEKLFNKTRGVNQIYTCSSDNKKLITNVVKPDTKQLKMYFIPSNQQQEVTLKASRLNSLKSVSSIIIEDHKTGRLMDLMKTSFTFLSSPSDKVDRFTLHINSNLVGVEDIKANAPLSAYYSFGQITVKGLDTSDLGKDMMIYNMQGQLMYTHTITTVDACTIQKPLEKGVYVVKIAGKSQALKLLVSK